MSKTVRQAVIQQLWQHWRNNSPEAMQIENALREKTRHPIILDHFAIIDLPSAHSGMSVLRSLFSAIGYQERGQGYLPEKQNDFLWMAEEDSAANTPQNTLPQAVVADFRLHEMPIEIRSIIEKYAAQTKPSPLHAITQLNDPQQIASLICAYLNTGRDWPLPTVKDFLTVYEFNELLAWVLVFGRKPNHFTISVHLLPDYNDLAEFNTFIEQELGLPLNRDGGLIKGQKESGIAQSSTKGILRTVPLADGEVQLPTEFTEFVWRYPASSTAPTLWQDYFTGFIAQHADYVIESLYRE